MAAVQYQVFCRYYNSDMSKCITNLTTSEWSSSRSNKNTESKEVFEFYVEPKPDPKDPWTPEEIETIKRQNNQKIHNLQTKIIEGNKATNPKFDMLFVYDGRDVIDSDVVSGQLPYVLTDKMKRVLISPWFVHSTHGSLESAMQKAKSLIKKIGIDNVSVGKVIPLEQYIEII
jgi:hypothetical protein